MLEGSSISGSEGQGKELYVPATGSQWNFKQRTNRT